MTLYPYLVSALILSVVDSQTANVTEDQTSTTANSTVKIRNVTSSLSEEEKTQIEEELENNQTSAVITEDDEKFQDQEPKIRRCARDNLVIYSRSFCGENFHKEMLSIDEENWCVLDSVIRPYSHITFCLEELSSLMGCYYPNPDIQDFFLHIHTLYFHNCSSKELPLADIPDGLAIALTLIPVSLIPVLVHLAVCKSKVRE